jgi:hypothetical protein
MALVTGDDDTNGDCRYGSHCRCDCPTSCTVRPARELLPARGSRSMRQQDLWPTPTLTSAGHRYPPPVPLPEGVAARVLPSPKGAPRLPARRDRARRVRP